MLPRYVTYLSIFYIICQSVYFTLFSLVYNYFYSKMKLLIKLIIIDRIIPVGGKKMKRNIIIVLIAICTLFILISCYIYIINKNKIPVLCYHNLATAEEKTNFESEKDWTIDVKNFEEQLK